MNRSAPHPVLAWYFDVWLLSSIVRAAANVVDSEVAPPFRVFWSICGVLFVLVVPTVYHAAWSASARFLSFGEHVFGRALVEDRKIWLNPYGTSRALLFGCAAYGLLVQLSVSPRHELAGSYAFLMELLLLGIAAGSLIVLGRGHAWALLGIVVYRALERTAQLPPLSFDSIDNLTWFAIVHAETIFFALVAAAVAHNYSAARGRVMATELAA